MELPINAVSACTLVTFNLKKQYLTRIAIGKDVTNVGKYSVSTDDPGSGQMRVGIEVKDNDGNMLYSNNNIQNKNKFSFTTHTYSDYRICFENVLDSGVTPSPTYKRTIKFDMSVGPNANDYVAELKQEHLKPIEVDLRVLEAQMDTIVKEMDYLKEREISMRDTNESTNERVQWLSLLSMLTLVGSGLWQLVYLRQFFKSKKLL